MHMQYKSQPLFSKYGLQRYLDDRLQKAEDSIDKIPREKFLGMDDDEIREKIIDLFQVHKLSFDFEKKTMEYIEVKVDTADYPSEYAPRRGKSVLVDA